MNIPVLFEEVIQDLSEMEKGKGIKTFPVYLNPDNPEEYYFSIR